MSGGRKREGGGGKKERKKENGDAVMKEEKDQVWIKEIGLSVRLRDGGDEQRGGETTK